jgi:hypothetical protein
MTHSRDSSNIKNQNRRKKQNRFCKDTNT